MDYAKRYQVLMDSPGVHTVVKDAIQALAGTDPVDAYYNARLVMEWAKQRVEEVQGKGVRS